MCSERRPCGQHICVCDLSLPRVSVNRIPVDSLTGAIANEEDRLVYGSRRVRANRRRSFYEVQRIIHSRTAFQSDQLVPDALVGSREERADFSKK